MSYNYHLNNSTLKITEDAKNQLIAKHKINVFYNYDAAWDACEKEFPQFDVSFDPVNEDIIIENINHEFAKEAFRAQNANTDEEKFAVLRNILNTSEVLVGNAVLVDENNRKIEILL